MPHHRWLRHDSLWPALLWDAPVCGLGVQSSLQWELSSRPRRVVSQTRLSTGSATSWLHVCGGVFSGPWDWP